MSAVSITSTRPDPAIGFVIASGVVALAVAMGVGRFAFTPLLPLMMRDGSLTAHAGAEWATANYVGYFAGALTASWFAAAPRRGLLLGLLGVALTTLGAGIDLGSMTLAGPALRAAAGVSSGWTLVCASSWCLAELARLRAPQMGAWIYSGVGLGIALAGVVAWLGGRQPADWLWLEMGVLAAAGALSVWAMLRGWNQAPVVAPAGREARAPAPAARSSGKQLSLILCYGACGFGYIVPATFLPVMARELTSEPLVFGLMWPLFGMAATASVAAVALWLPRWSRVRIWAVAQGTMAVGTFLPLAAPALWSLAVSALLVGGTFIVVTMAGLQFARATRPDNPTPLLAKMSAAFAAGQIAGPALIRTLGDGRWAGSDALTWVGAVASVLLALTAAWLWRNADPSPPTPRQPR